MIEPTFISMLASAGAQSNSHRVAQDLLVLLLSAGVVSLLLRRLRFPIIPCYLLTGGLIGPTALSFITSEESIGSISSLAVVILMFTIGLHLSPSDLRGGGMLRVLLSGILSTVAVVLAFWPLSMAAGEPAPAALAIAVAISMSSTAVVMRVLSERRETQRLLGRLCIGVSITQDLLSLVALAMMPLMGAWAGASSTATGSSAFLLPVDWSAASKAVGGIVAITALIALGKLVLPRLILESARGSSSEIALVLAAGAALGAAVVASGLGFSPELGAFVAGFLLSSTPARHQLAGQLSPLRDLFMAVFFTAVGLKLDLPALGHDWPLVLVGAVAVLVLKSFMCAATFWAVGAPSVPSARAGVLLGQAGEFSIVVLAAAVAQGVIDRDANSAMIAIVVVTLVVTPMLFSRTDLLKPLLERVPVSGLWRSSSLRDEAPAPARGGAVGGGRGGVGVGPSAGSRASGEAGGPAGDPGGAVESTAPRASGGGGVARGAGQHSGTRAAGSAIIAGFGVVGRALADRFEVQGIPFCVVDLNQGTVLKQTALGRRAIYGDISNAEVLESAGLHSADVVLLTIPDDEASLRACRAIRAANPEVFIAMRTTFLSRAMAAMQLGADLVTVEEVAVAETMAKQVMEALARRESARQAGPRPDAAPPLPGASDGGQSLA